ncbi:hypothetical protein BD779DRAFT_1550995 [Infundibulicybe gibba]|nr:hypothetical protein BD779DRAFT_1550995 [Infundibulicybe gibba]
MQRLRCSEPSPTPPSMNINGAFGNHLEKCKRLREAIHSAPSPRQTRYSKATMRCSNGSIHTHRPRELNGDHCHSDLRVGPRRCCLCSVILSGENDENISPSRGHERSVHSEAHCSMEASPDLELRSLYLGLLIRPSKYSGRAIILGFLG